MLKQFILTDTNGIGFGVKILLIHFTQPHTKAPTIVKQTVQNPA